MRDTGPAHTLCAAEGPGPSAGQSEITTLGAWLRTPWSSAAGRAEPGAGRCTPTEVMATQAVRALDLAGEVCRAEAVP